MKVPAISILVLAALMAAPSRAEVATLESPPANASLLAFHERFARPSLIEVAPNVHTAFAYSISNFSFIEGKTGIILVDAGWTQKAMEAALRELRKKTRKPVVAIIYTHPHLDHTGGAKLAAADGRAPVQVIGPSDFGRQASTETSAINREVLKRAFSQMGAVLPLVGQKSVGSGVGPSEQIGPRGDLPPTMLIDRTQDLTIDGVRLTLFRVGGDIPETLMIWMPDQKILFAGDIMGGVFPYHETPRFEVARDPGNIVRSLDLALQLRPSKLVAGHGRVMLDSADVRDVLTVNRDVIQFMIDQIDRMLNNGMSSEQIVHSLRFPAALAAHPDIQPFYHRLDWIKRAMIVKRVGFFTEFMDLTRLDGIEENKRFVALMGGPQKVLATANEALASEPRWAARLATMAQAVAPQDKEAVRIKLLAYQGIAEKTISVNERNYLLTAIADESGKLNWPTILVPVQKAMAQGLTTPAIMKQMGSRLLPDKAAGERFRIGIRVTDEPEVYAFEVRNSVLAPAAPSEPMDAEVEISRDALNRLYAFDASLAGLVERQEAKITGKREIALRFADMLQN